MNDERFKELLNLDPEGVPSLTDVTKEIMRGPGQLVDVWPTMVSKVRNTEDAGLTTGVLADAMEAAMIEDTQYYASFDSSVPPRTDLPTCITNFEEACQSGSNDYRERRERDRSGTAPKKRKWKDRAKAKAARKARRNNR